MNIKKKNFTLVLSGGGALGIAHLGVLADLEKDSILPKEIIGTSMGGIIGACFAIGMREKEIHKYIEEFSAVYKWISFSFSGNAIVENRKIENIFENIFKDKKMRDTTIPLKLIATNLLNGHKRVFCSQDDIYIKDAILATMAIPGIFDEHIIGGETYGDGFLCENLGINEASFDDILAVDVMGENSFQKEMPDNFFKTSNVLEMFEKSMRLLIYNQTQTHIKNSNKNILLLEPETKDYKTFHFHKVDEIRALGLELLN
ncbi:patatin-like phospholipase family protein [Sulfurovum sp. bin170]|uniref:patatin-like phospholipase family protein n=1 Tax=Sulfurovum sp. bin170 TaxID=2695268 RepID=UPI0013E04E78|nr:patatin-like phospholipase family protein [Sulfurovum sp. bin170]NEW59869.1 patatin-like phospholipase family protein [Sulfurovum sp. bin170]